MAGGRMETASTPRACPALLPRHVRSHRQRLRGGAPTCGRKCSRWTCCRPSATTRRTRGRPPIPKRSSAVAAKSKPRARAAVPGPAGERRRVPGNRGRTRLTFVTPGLMPTRARAVRTPPDGRPPQLSLAEAVIRADFLEHREYALQPDLRCRSNVTHRYGSIKRERRDDRPRYRPGRRCSARAARQDDDRRLLAGLTRPTKNRTGPLRRRSAKRRSAAASGDAAGRAGAETLTVSEHITLFSS